MDNQSKEYGQANFSLPHDVVPLPSQGIFYKNKKKAVKVGYLTANDENLLMAGGEDMTPNLLRTKIYEPDLRVEEMLEGDVEAILIFLRNTAFGPEMEVSLTDPETRKPFKTTILMDQLTILQGQAPNEDPNDISSSGGHPPIEIPSLSEYEKGIVEGYRRANENLRFYFGVEE